MSHRRLEQAGGFLPWRQAVDADASEREGEEEEQASPVCDDESDAEPGGLGELIG